MRYRVQNARPTQHKKAGELEAVQATLRERNGGYAMAMVFDPGSTESERLLVHAADVMLGLMYLRGWRKLEEQVLIGLASNWSDQWWERAPGANAFVIEANLAPTPESDSGDLDRIATLTSLAWCMEHDLHARERPMPDLMTAFGPDGIAIASIHPEPMARAMRGHRETINERMTGLPEPIRSATYTHVLMHIEGTSLRPWALADRTCNFGTGRSETAGDRLFIALRDTNPAAKPETTRSLLSMMLASGTDD